MDGGPVERMFTTYPQLGDYAIAQAARAAIVSALEGATPGRHSGFPVNGDTFLRIFFPDWAPAPYAADVSPAFPQVRWSGFAVAVLCQAMFNLASDLRPQLRQDKIDGDIAGFNAAVSAQAVAWYAHVFANASQDFASAYAEAGEKARVLAEYTTQLTSDHYVTSRRAMVASSTWTNQTPELFHHWLKLTILGASDALVDQTIAKLAGMQLPIPPALQAGQWRGYMGWLGPGAPGVNIRWVDIQSASAGITKRECQFYDGVPSCMDDENSFEFTANGQPGSGYRKPPSGGSCFAGDTLVALADGGTARIDTVRPGDRVRTPGGAGTVALVARPRREGRPLYSLDSHRFRFSATHPFVLGDDPPHALAAVDPRALERFVGTLAHAGVAHIGQRPALLMCAQDGALAPRRAGEVRSHDAPGDPEEQLYDLILEPDEDGFPAYLAGDEQGLYAVASELPRPLGAPFAALALAQLLTVAAPALREPLASLPADHLARRLDEPLRRISSTLMADAWVRVGERPAAGTPPASDAVEPSDAVAAIMAAFAGNEHDYDPRMGALFEWLSGRHVDELSAMVEMGWRVPGVRDGEAQPQLLALSVEDVVLRDPLGVGTSLSVAVRIDGDAPRLAAERGRRSGCAFVRHFDDTVYVRPWPGGGGLSLELVDAGGEPLGLRADHWLPASLDHGYRRFQALLWDHHETHRGEIVYDVRPLTEELAAREAARRDGWDERARVGFAVALGRACGELLAQRLPTAVGRGPHVAA
jgi:hypothetical protein